LKDYKDLTKEELLALLNKVNTDLLNTKDELSNTQKELKNSKKELKNSKKELEDSKKELEDSKKEQEELRVENRNLQAKINELIKKYEHKIEITKKTIIDSYMPKSERITNTMIINELEKSNEEKKTRKTPYKSIVEDLKELGVDNVITVDYDFEANGVNKESVKPFGKDESYKIEIEAPNVSVNKVERLKYKDKDHIYESLNDDIFPHSPLTPSLGSHIINIKYVLGVPFYRYSNYLNTFGINISEADIVNWASKIIDLLEPIYNAILDKLIHTDIKAIHIDETTIPIIDSNKDKCYMFAYTSTVWDTPLFIYDFNETRKMDHTLDILKDYDGYVIVDGYSAYNKLTEKGIRLQKCICHVRRKWFDVLKALNESERELSPAFKIVKTIEELYRNESKFKDNKLTPSKIKEERNKAYYLDIINRLDSLIEAEHDNPSHLVHVAAKYYKNQRPYLFTYLEDGYLPIDNNRIERDAIKSFVINRKAFLFCKSANGAIKTAKIFSIVQTARANGLKVEQYLKYLISNINKKTIEELLPWSSDLPIDLLITPKDIQ